MAAVVRLTKPIKLFDKQISEIKLREPTGGMYALLGDPRVFVYNQSGSGYWIEKQESISGYLDKLVEHESGGEVLFSLLSLEDAFAVKQALFGFFDDAMAKYAARESARSSSAVAP